jgi:hypothetical protein
MQSPAQNLPSQDISPSPASQSGAPLSPWRRARKFLGKCYIAWIAVFGLFRCWVRYLWTGQNGKSAFEYLVNAYCRTHGVSNEVFHGVCRVFRPKKRLSSHAGVLGDITGAKKKHVLSLLKRDGYFVFPQALHPKVVDALVLAANTLKAQPTPVPENTPPYIHFKNREKYPWAPTYRFDEKDILTISEVQSIIADYSFLSVAQEYLGCLPVLDIVAMWWSAAGNGQPSTEAAQLYHFDMDRTRWLKFIIYLTDVTPETGPHAYIRGTHHPFTKPSQLLKHNYARISDEEIGLYYEESRFEEFSAPKGTVIAVDTIGFHKGTVLKKDVRLVLELEYANSLFGIPFTKTPVRPIPHSPLSNRLAEHPKLYSKFEIQKGF